MPMPSHKLARLRLLNAAEQAAAARATYGLGSRAYHVLDRHVRDAHQMCVSTRKSNRRPRLAVAR